MNDTLIENIKLKSDLEYDLLFESNQYELLDSDLKSFLKESYDSGVNFSIDIQKDKVLLEMIEQNPLLLESIDEGLWDRFKATVARAGQGLKNATRIGQQTADSKDAGVASLFNNFKNKFQKASTPPAAEQPSGKIGDEVVDKFKEIEDKSVKGPPIDPNQGLKMVDNSNAPKGLKDKIKQAIVNNPGKTKFLLGVLSFGAGVAAAAVTGGNPIAGKIAGSLINGIGNAAIAKAQGRGNGDAVMSGLGGAIAGYGLANLGATATNAISNFATGLIPGADPNAYQVTKTTGGGGVPKGGGGGGAYPFDQTNPNKLYPDNVSGGSTGGGGAYPFDQTNPNKLYPDNVSGGATGTGAGSSPYQAYDPNQPNYVGGDTAGGTVAGGTTSGGGAYPFDQTNPNKLYPDTGVDTSVTTNQNFPGTKPEDIVPGSANDPNQGMYATAAKKIPRPSYTKGAELLQRGFRKENVEKTFTKSYNNTYVLNKKSNVISENEKQIDETWEENINEALNAEQQKIYDEFLTDLGKMFKQPKDQIIQFMQSQGSRFKDILDFIGQNVTSAAAAPATPPVQPGDIPQITPQLRLDVDTKIKTLLSGLTILNPKVQKLLKKNPATRVAGKNASYVFRLTNTGDIAFIIKGWIGQTSFLYQDKPTIAQQNAQQVLIKEIAYKPIDTLKNNFIVQLSKNLALYYSKLPQLAGQLKQDQLETVISNHLTEVAKTNPGFNKLFGSILTLLDSVSTRMKASKNKPKQIWIGITSKGMGLFTGLPSKKKVQAGKPQAVKPQAGKVQAGKSSVRKNP